MSEKTVSIVGLFLVTSYVAKYVGPSVFGIIALATATFQIIQIISQLGNDNIIFKRVSKNELSGINLIKATFLIRTFIYILLSIPTLYYFYTYKDSTMLIFSISICVACYFSSVDVFSIYNNAVLKSRINTIANIIGLSISLLIQYTIAYNKLPPEYLSISIVLTTLIPLCIRYYIFPGRKIKKISLVNSIKYNKYILLSGFSIVFSTLSIAIYTRINQFMISYWEGEYSLGVYSVAMTLSTTWAFILLAIINSTLPSIFSEKSDTNSLNITAKLNVLIIFISLFALIGISIFGNYFIILLFGDAYTEASNILVILCLSTMFGNLGMVSARFIIRYSGYKFLSKKMLCMLLLSVPISYFMVKNWGILGAAYSVLTVEIISLTFMNYFFKGGIILKLHMKTVNLKKLFSK